MVTPKGRWISRPKFANEEKLKVVDVKEERDENFTSKFKQTMYLKDMYCSIAHISDDRLSTPTCWR